MMDRYSPALSSSRLRDGVWYCRLCFEARLIHSFHETACDDDLDEGNGEAVEDEEETFRREHRGHPLAPLKKKKDRCFADRPLWDPLRTAYEEVTDGRETFLLKSWRTDLNAPRRYALLRGELALSTTVQLPEEPLREELALTCGCSPQQADEIVKRLQRMVAAFPPEDLLPAYCSADDPHVLFSHLNERQLRLCVESCQTESAVFDKAKLRDFFLQRHQADALTLELRQQFTLHFS